MYDVDIKAMGPLFSGAIYGQMKRVIAEIEDAIADELVDTVQSIDTRTFKNPTGNARSKVRAQRTKGAVIVDRSRLSYGPWLEDGGSRSDIFKGYHAFEKAKRTVDAKTPDIADRIVQRYLIRA